MNFDEQLLSYTNSVNAQLEKYMTARPCKQQPLLEAMRYSVCSGGKRIRAVLALEFCRITGGQVQNAMPAACAIEMIHAFSLIHDDLPCMDDDDVRRGKPTCHKAFGEATALLAGDALQLLAFEIISSCSAPPERALKAINKLAACAGGHGMTGGQQLDLQYEAQKATADELLEMYGLKTSCLLEAAVCLGCYFAGASEDTARQAAKYAHFLGLAFQIVDDILDVEGTVEQLGKPIGSDIANHKETYVSIYGLDAAKKTASELTENAINALAAFEDNEFVIWLTQKLLLRNR